MPSKKATLDKMMMVGVMVVMMMVELVMMVELMMVGSILPLWPTRVGEGRGQQLVFACSTWFALMLKWSFLYVKLYLKQSGPVSSFILPILG